VDAVAEADGLGLAVGVIVGDALIVGEALELADGDAVAEADGLELAVGVIVGDALIVGEALELADGDAVGVGVALADSTSDSEGVGLVITAGSSSRLPVRAVISSSVGDADGVVLAGSGDASTTAAGDSLDPALEVGSAVGNDEEDGLGVGEVLGRTEGDALGEAVVDALGDGEAEGDGEDESSDCVALHNAGMSAGIVHVVSDESTDSVVPTSTSLAADSDDAVSVGSGTMTDGEASTACAGTARPKVATTTTGALMSDTMRRGRFDEPTINSLTFNCSHAES